MSSFSNVFSSLGQNLEGAVNTFVTSKVSAVVSIAAPIALAGVTLYIVIYGYMIITGRVQQPFYDFSIKCVKIIIIAAFSVAGNYGQLSSVIEGFQTDMVQAMGGATSIYGSLDAAADSCLEVLTKINQKNASIPAFMFGTKMGYWLMFAVVATAYLLILIGVATTVIVSMVFLKILLALGPIFVMCLMFPPVSRFFDNWFGAVMSNVFVTVIGSAFAVIALKILSTTTGVVDVNSSGINPWSAVLGICAISVVLFIASRSIASLSAGLGGGVASEAVSAGQALASTLGLNPTPRQINNIKSGLSVVKKMGSWGKNKFVNKSIASAQPSQPAYRRMHKYH